MDLKGICPIITTPFFDSGEVDFESLVNEVNVLAENGCHGLTLFGIAGEYYKLSDSESEQIANVIVDACHKKNIPIIVSVTQHSTELAVKRALYYQKIGADAIMLLPPFFLKPSASDVFNHMLNVCRAVDIPVVVQYAPEQTGVSISPKTLANLCNMANKPLYFKIECKPAGGYISTLLNETDKIKGIFIGNAGYQFIECFDRGAIGAMPGASMFDLYLQIYDAYRSGDRTRAKFLHGSVLLPMLNHIRQNVEMIILFEKKIMHQRGVIATDYCRYPRFSSDAVFEAIFEEMLEQTRQFFLPLK